MGQYVLTIFTAILLVSGCYSERFGFGGGLRLGQKGIKSGSGLGDSIFNEEEDKNTSDDPQKVATETKLKAYGEVSKTKQDVGGGTETQNTQNTEQSVEGNKEIEGEVSGSVSVQKNGPPKRGGKFQFPCGTF